MSIYEPGQRLITQNLLISASSFEHKKKIGLSALQDLSTLINIFCLYDKVIVLKRSYWHFIDEIKSLKLETLSMLDNHSFIKVDAPEGNQRESIALTAKKHLATFLGEENIDKFDPLFHYSLSPNTVDYGLCYEADDITEIEKGTQYLKGKTSRNSLMSPKWG